MERLPEMLKIYSDLGYDYRKDVFAADTVAVKQ
jgi:hexosaminidase